MEGTELLSKLRKTEPEMIKIIITGYATLDNSIEATNKGVDGYIVKPFDSRKLTSLIESKLKEQRKKIQFDEKKVKDYLMSLGGNSIESIYQPEEIKFKVFEPKFLIFLTIVAVLSAATTYISIDKLMYITPFDFMLNQKKGSAQAESSFFTDKYEMRQPPVGTVARGFLLYEFIRVADTNQFYGNPLLPTKKVLVLGQSKFLTFCSPCHGDYADDNSRLMAQFPPGPTLHSARVISFTDGKIYNIITNGQNVMPSYDSQITREERWSIINYIRVLQRAQNPKPSDFTTIKEFKKESGNVQN